MARLSAPSAHLRLDLALGSIEELAAQGLGLSAPFLLKAIVDRLGEPTARAADLWALVVGFVFAWTSSGVFAVLKLLHTHRMVDRLQRQISAKALERQLPGLAAHDNADSGGLAGVLERLPQSLHLIIDGLIWRTGPQILQLVAGVAAVGWTLPLRFAALLGAALAAYLLTTRLNARAIVEAAAQANRSLADTSTLRADILRNAARVVCNNALAREQGGLDRALEADHRASQLLAQRIIISQAVQYLVLCVGLSAVLGVAGVDTLESRLRAGDFVLLQAFALRLALPLAGIAITLRQSSLALANVRDALALGRVTGRDPVHRIIPMMAPQPGLALSDVSFRHPGGGGVEAVTLTLAPGQWVAIVGANGSGKSTLARLMAGLLQPQHGDIWLDGAPLSRPHDGIRQRALYVPQFISLFNRSLAENGLYPPARLTVDQFGERLQAWAFQGGGISIDLTRSAGEQGLALSGGQVQKLELARLCAVDTPVLILDESTSALDGPSEAEILRTLRAQCAGRLLALVTHRRSVAESADRVLFMDGGRLSAAGPHHSLLCRPDYARLWASG